MIALLIRDLRLAIRAGGGFGLGLAFFLLVAVIVPLGVGPEQAVLAKIAPGILWVGALLACLLSLDRIFALDFEDGSLDLLATSPMPLEGVVAVKSLAHWLVTGLPLVLAAPVLGVLLNLPVAGYGWLLVSLALGTPAVAVIGSFGAALGVGVKRGGLLMSLLVLPLYIPTLIFGAEVVKRGAQGLAVGTPLALLAGITAGAVALLPFASAAAIRVNLRYAERVRKARTGRGGTYVDLGIREPQAVHADFGDFAALGDGGGAGLPCGGGGMGGFFYAGCRQVRIDGEDHLPACAGGDDGNLGLDDDAGDKPDLAGAAAPCQCAVGQGSGPDRADLHADRAGDGGDLGAADVGDVVGMGPAADLVPDPVAVLSGLYRAVAGG